MDSGTLALWLVGVLWALFALWVWVSQKFMTNAHELHRALRERQDEQMQGHRVLMAGDASRTEWLRELEERVAGAEALLVSTVGQETELSEEFCGKFGKKGGAR